MKITIVNKKSKVLLNKDLKTWWIWCHRNL